MLLGLAFTAPGLAGVGDLGGAVVGAVPTPGSGLGPCCAVLGVTGAIAASTSLGKKVVDKVLGALVPNPPEMGCGVPVSKRSFTFCVR